MYKPVSVSSWLPEWVYQRMMVAQFGFASSFSVGFPATEDEQKRFLRELYVAAGDNPFRVTVRLNYEIVSSFGPPPELDW